MTALMLLPMRVEAGTSQRTPIKGARDGPSSFDAFWIPLPHLRHLRDLPRRQPP